MKAGTGVHWAQPMSPESTRGKGLPSCCLRDCNNYYQKVKEHVGTSDVTHFSLNPCLFFEMSLHRPSKSSACSLQPSPFQFYFIFLTFWDRVLPCSILRPWILDPDSAFYQLGSQTYTTRPVTIFIFWGKCSGFLDLNDKHGNVLWGYSGDKSATSTWIRARL